MAKQTSSNDVINLEQEKVETKEKIPEIKLDKEENANTYIKKVKIKLIKDLPKVYIAGEYYYGNAGDTLTVPLFVAYVLKGSDNKTEVFAV